MKVTSKALYSARLNNNCPECYDTNGLELRFFQSEKENALYIQASGEFSSEMHCHTCNTTIFPVSWDEDIEKVFEYHKKRVEAKSTKIRLKPLAYGIIIMDLAIVVILLIYFLK